MSFSLRSLCAAAALGVLAVVSTRCELLVDLDRGQVDGAVPVGCPICTNLTEGGDEQEVAASGDASLEDAGSDAAGGDDSDAGFSDATTESADTDGAGE